MAVKFLDYTGLGYFCSKIKAWCNATFAAITHNQASNTINAMTGYSKPNSGSAIAASDSLNSAIGKLEVKIDAIDQSNIVHITGNETITGYKTFSGFAHTGSNGGTVYGFELRHPDMDLDELPSVRKYHGIYFCDKENPEWDSTTNKALGRLGCIETCQSTADQNYIGIYSYKHSSNGIYSTGLAVGIDPNNINYATAPETSTSRNERIDIVTRGFLEDKGYLTSHQTLPTLSLTTSGSGNAITALSVNNYVITATKGSTFLTSHQDISGKVNKSGDTMTGTLTITSERTICSALDRADTTTDSAPEAWRYEYVDANSVILGNYGIQRGHKNGYTQHRFRVRNTGNKWADLIFTINDDNTYQLSLAGQSGTTSNGFIGSSTSCTGNAATATKLATARTINIQDSSATNTGTGASFDGSGNATIKLPATIKASITGNCSGSSGSCTGNAATATKLATARNLKVALNSTTAVTFDGSANQNSIPVSGTLAVANGGTGSSTKNFVDLSNDQTIGGDKTFTEPIYVSRGIPIITLINTSTASDSYIDIRCNVRGTGGGLTTRFRTYYNKDFYIYGTHSSTTSGDGALLYLKQDGTAALSSQAGSSGTRRYLTCGTGGTLTWNGQTVQTSSDERLKTPMISVPESILDAWGDVEWGQFQFLDAVAEKGVDKARLHVGLIAQRVQQVFNSRGLDVLDYGILCYDVRETVEHVAKVVDQEAYVDEYGVEHPEVSHEERDVEQGYEQWQARYTEALCMEAAYQRRKNKILENRISELERQVSNMLQILQSLKGAN